MGVMYGRVNAKDGGALTVTGGLTPSQTYGPFRLGANARLDSVYYKPTGTSPSMSIEYVPYLDSSTASTTLTTIIANTATGPVNATTKWSFTAPLTTMPSSPWFALKFTNLSASNAVTDLSVKYTTKEDL